MANVAIKTDHLCKRYLIKHESQGGAYANMKDVIAEKIRAIFKGSNTPSVTREEINVLQDLNISVEQGSRVGIIGRNGAGKSTLLKILSKITQPTSGTVVTNGRIVSLLEVGTGFHPELTGRENVFLNGVIMGMSRADIKQRFDQIVAFSEVEQYLDTPVKRYSSGMYMRLAFAVAAHLEPEILIVDEVLAVGDGQFQKKCIAKMDEISRSNDVTVLFVSHNLEAIRSFCNRGIFLHQGKLVSQGPIEPVVDDYSRIMKVSRKEHTPHTQHPIYFETLELTKNNYYFGETMSLKCCIRADKKYEQYIIGISAVDSYDHIVGTILVNSIYGLANGSNTVSLQIPLGTIVPGDYTLTLAIALDEALNNVDVVYNYPEFSVLSDSEHQQLFSRWSQSWGGNILAGTHIV